MRGLLAAAAFACVAVCAWYLLSSHDPREPGSGVAAQAATARPASAPATTGAPVQDGTATAMPRVPVANPGSRPTHVVQVIAFGTKQPVAGASVRYLPAGFA